MHFFCPMMDISDLMHRYMRICGRAAGILHGTYKPTNSFPREELKDYWTIPACYTDSTGGELYEELPLYSSVLSAPLVPVQGRLRYTLPPPDYQLEDDPRPSESGCR